jgi:tetratricopeptide (TPR) repeat protein
MLGDFYFSNGEMEKARTEYASLYSQHPNDLEVKRNYVQLLIMAKQFDEASRIVNEILKSSPGDVAGLTYSGQLQLINGNSNAAVSTLQAAVKNDPSQAGAHYQLGLAYQAQGDLQSAEGEWREAIRLNPNMLQAQRTLALLAMRTGDMGTLETATSQMISLQPDKPEGYALRAVAYINQKKFQLAQQDIQMAIAVDPTSQLGYVQLGNLQFAQTDYAAAALSYQEGLDRDSNSSDALRGLMNSYLAQHQVDRAVAAANAQVAKAPNKSEFYNLLGTSLFRAKKDFSGAEAAFGKALLLEPTNTDARLKLAQAQSTAGRLDQAIATCQQGIQVQPRIADFYLLLGELYQAKRNWSSAKSSLEKAREIEPGNPVTARELANVLVNSGGNLDEALSLAQSAQRSAPNSPYAVDTLGWVYYQKGEYSLALNILQQALKLLQSQNAAGSADIHYHLGLTYQKSLHPALARQHLEQALKIDPNYPAANDIKKQLTTLKS